MSSKPQNPKTPWSLVSYIIVLRNCTCLVRFPCDILRCSMRSLVNPGPYWSVQSRIRLVLRYILIQLSLLNRKPKVVINHLKMNLFIIKLLLILNQLQKWLSVLNFFTVSLLIPDWPEFEWCKSYSGTSSAALWFSYYNLLSSDFRSIILRC